MLWIARPEQGHMHTGFVSHKAIGRIRHTTGTTFMDEKSQWIICVGEPLGHLASGREFLHLGGKTSGLAKNIAYDKHQERSDVIRYGVGKDFGAGIVMHHVK